MLEVSPALVGSQVHTGEQPVGILHIAVDTGYESGLLEVRSVGRGIEAVDEYVVITLDQAEEIGIILLFIIGQIDGLSSGVGKGALLLHGQQVAFRRRLHAGRTIGLTVRAEIESLNLVT